MNMDLALPGVGLLVLRLTFGLLTFAHGYQKWGKLDKFMNAWGLRRSVAVSVMLIQIFGGMFIFFGIFTQLAALANCIVNTAILHALITRTDEPFVAPAQHSWSIGLAYFGMALALALGGGGALTLEALL